MPSLHPRTLFEMSNKKQWDDVLARINTLPLADAVSEIYYVDTTFLFALIMGAPVTLLCRMVELCKLANCNVVGTYNASGRLPLHDTAAFFISDEVIALLIREHPQALVTEDRQGRTPLQHYEYACRIFGEDDEGTPKEVMLRASTEAMKIRDWAALALHVSGDATALRRRSLSTAALQSEDARFAVLLSVSRAERPARRSKRKVISAERAMDFYLAAITLDDDVWSCIVMYL
jgi:hypothetical protein